MKVKNKRTRERIQLSYTEFQSKFANELKIAFESYIQTEESKHYFRINKTPESDFYFNLQWNLRLAGRVRSAFAEQNT